MSTPDSGQLNEGEPEPVVCRAFAELVGRQAWRSVTFTSSAGAGRIEVEFNGQSYRLLIRHAERRGLLPRLQTLGYGIPSWWSMVHDRRSGWLSKGRLEVVVPAAERAAVEALVHLIGREVFGWKRTDPWTARLKR